MASLPLTRSTLSAPDGNRLLSGDGNSDDKAGGNASGDPHHHGDREQETSHHAPRPAVACAPRALSQGNKPNYNPPRPPPPTYGRSFFPSDDSDESEVESIDESDDDPDEGNDLDDASGVDSSDDDDNDNDNSKIDSRNLVLGPPPQFASGRAISQKFLIPQRPPPEPRCPPGRLKLGPGFRPRPPGVFHTFGPGYRPFSPRPRTIEFRFRTRLIRAAATPADPEHHNVLSLRVQPSRVQRLIESAVGMLPARARAWIGARFPEWTLPPRLVLKRQKKGWAREFNTEKVAYERLRPLQGVVIPRYFGELRYRRRRAILLSDIGGASLVTPEGMLVQLDEFRRLLFQALNSFSPFGITHGDNKLDNYHVSGDKIMIVDLEKIDVDIIDEDERPAVNEAIVDFLSGHYQKLQNQFWETGLIVVDGG